MLYNAIALFVNWQYTPYIFGGFAIAGLFKIIKEIF